MTQSSPTSENCYPSITIGQAPPILIRTIDDFSDISPVMADSPAQITVTLSGILQLMSFVLRVFARFLAAHRDRLQFRRPSGHSTTDPFEALDAAFDSDTTNETVIRTVVEIAAARNAHDSDDQAAVNRVRDFLQRRRISCPRDLANSIRSATLRSRHAGCNQPRIIDLLNQAAANGNGLAADPDLVLPPGWVYDEQQDALVREAGALRGELVISLDGILFAAQKTIDSATGKHRIEIVWFRHGQLHRHFVDRQQLVTARSAEELSAFGLPVSSNNSKLWVAYFDDFLRSNEFRLATGRVAGHFGWQTISESPIFALGDSIIAPRDAQVQTVHLEDSDPQFRKTAAAFRQAGDRQRSVELLGEVSSFPSVWFSICSVLSSPLLEPLGLRQFILDLCGETSSGKTVVATICASLWGNPEADVDDGSSVIQNWNLSRVFVERLAAQRRSLPLFLDDTKQVTDP